jgi:hypothetical protein
MPIRTVRLDDESEKVLEEIRAATGLRVSEALKRGLQALRSELQHDAGRVAYDVYQELDLGAGGHASVPSSAVKRGVREKLKKKLSR